MDSVIPRKALLRRTLALAATAVAGATACRATARACRYSLECFRSRSAVESARVKKFVIAGHANLAKVKEMLAAQPAIANATWDWGSGDFETALGGASTHGPA